MSLTMTPGDGNVEECLDVLNDLINELPYGLTVMAMALRVHLALHTRGGTRLSQRPGARRASVRGERRVLAARGPQCLQPHCGRTPVSRVGGGCGGDGARAAAGAAGDA